jgi:hypothetical protein
MASPFRAGEFTIRIKANNTMSWIRRRVEQWPEQGEKVVIRENINEAPGMD